MLSHRYKCIFVHIPKTAGQSIEQFFLDRYKLPFTTRSLLLLRSNADPTVGPPRLAHLTALEYIKGSHVSREMFNTYFKFSFVRNPWSRMLSEYKYRKNCNMKWECWLKDVCSVKDTDRFDDKIRHIKPQYDFLFDQNKQLVDFIGRFENLQQDFNIVCDRIGIERKKLPYRNRSKHKHYTEYYDEETKQIVADRYAKDIEYFGYSYGE